MLMGSNYIYIELETKNYKNNLPRYIIDNHDSNYIDSVNYMLPNYTMIKFRDKGSNIDESYNIFKMILNSRDWNVNVINIE
jgi:hypothetical protein